MATFHSDEVAPPGAIENQYLNVDDASSCDDAIREIYPENIQNTIVTRAPEERFKLGTWSVMGLVVNRIIGSGIFASPAIVMTGTQSVGWSLIFWGLGALYGLTGTYLYIEFGLSVPRHMYKGVDTGIPRSGGTLHYLQYAFPWPAYRPRVVVLITCIFSATFIILGNMAGNCLVFGIEVLRAAGIQDPPKGKAVGIAISVAAASCLIHAFSRRGLCAQGGVFHTQTYAGENMSPETSFKDSSSDAKGYANAFLSVLFAATGFEQPNYVLGEIRQPHKTFPKGTAIGVSLVYILYVLVNISYMIVVPKSAQIGANADVAQEFFTRTFGQHTLHSDRILASFKVLSAFGNIVVMTFIAARIKQEIAKEGILPWPEFFGSSRNVSFGRFLEWVRQQKDNFIVNKFWWLLKLSWMNPREHSEETPLGAMFLHWVFEVALILVTIHLSLQDAYNFLVSLYSYAVVALFGFFVAIAMLKLRFTPSENWKAKSNASPFFSITSSILFAIGCAFPIITYWVKSINSSDQTVPWYVVPTVSWSILVLGVLWYVGFRGKAALRYRANKVIFEVEKIEKFEPDPHPDGPPVQFDETVYMAWVAKEANLTDVERASNASRESF